MIYSEHTPPKLISSIWVSVREAGDNGSPDCLYDQSAPYEQDIRRILNGLPSEKFPSTDLMTYFSLPDHPEMEALIRSRVRAAPLRIQSIGNTLCAVVEPELSAPLEEEALTAFAGQLEYQFQEGWGAEFEVASTITAQGDEEVCARLCREGIRVFTSEEYLELTQPETPGNQMSMQF